MSLNNSQLKAMDHLNGPLLVLSGPGSGKTTVIVNRVANLIKKHRILPENILVLTFTNSAAKEMKERFLRGFESFYAEIKMAEGKESVLPKEDHEIPDMVTFGTFHSVFFSILKEFYGYSGENIIKEWEKHNILRDILNSVRYDERYNLQMEDTKENLQMILSEISEVKHNEDYKVQSLDEVTFSKIYKEYERRVKGLKKIDFEDMLYDTYKLLNTNAELLEKVRQRYQYILVDEYQDINEIQDKIVRLIAAPRNNIFVVGDDDQAIYGFRGATPELILDFEKKYPGGDCVRLDINYRCHKKIVEASLNVINHNKKRFKKDIKAFEKVESSEKNSKSQIEDKKDMHDEDKVLEIKCFENMQEQCEFIIDEYKKLIEINGYKKVAVLYRTNANPLLLCQLLTEKNVDFTIKDKVRNIYENIMVMDVLTYLSIASGDMRRSNFLKIINKPYRDIPREIFNEEYIDLIKVENIANDKMMDGRITKIQFKNIMDFCKGIRFIQGMNTYGAISYIRYGLGYQLHMENNRKKNKNCNEDEDIMNIMEIVQGQAKKYVRIQEFLEFVEEYRRELYEKENSSSSVKQRKENIQTKKGAGILTKNGIPLILSTIHASKGLEYDAVFIMDANEKIIPHGRSIGIDSIEEERRLFYVAMTRAAKKLYILYTKERYGKELPVSRFVREIGEEENQHNE